ncbi:PIG-L family deacetylase [Flavimarina sp. Hel_I_48]|uniref:PIG-L family deacetylase n=1 Tax=Flavimarina sp. Hel_I_48 TaxID=1392488 RepID=UPI0004DF7040|nr:PIG-L family deacetylase [Flavimarina sp. Hel_I_48]
MISKLRVILILVLFSCLGMQAQRPQKPDAVQIFEKIQKLNFLGSALYVAAHPDDENTAMISYLSNEVHARTGYLSMTRGDGGQNLVGPELSELLGAIRTQELLAARKIDGGIQRFTRANDFGYSKNPEETLNIWDKDKVLSDVVWAIRKFKPDVIINRFDHRSPGTTHGHHTSSAMLSVEAFDLANNPKKFPEQLEYTSVWQPKRQFFNTSWWFYGSREKFEEADKGNLVSVDVGVYYTDLGLSNTEISAMSRSQHRSQGFGNTGSRGSQVEYLELLKGDYPENGNIFEGIDTSWNRLENGAALGIILDSLQRNFQFDDPAASLPALLEAYGLLTALKESHWKTIKTEELKEIIKACAGLYLEAATSQQTATPFEDIEVTLEAINRSDFPVRMLDVVLQPVSNQIAINDTLKNNIDFQKAVVMNTGEAAFTTAYWLENKGSLGMYKVGDQELIGLPETPHAFQAVFTISLNGTEIPFSTPLVYKYTDRVNGEVYEPFEILPAFGARIQEPVIIFANTEPKEITVQVTAYRDSTEASVSLSHPDGWQVAPAEATLQFESKGQTKNIVFKVTPPSDDSQGNLNPVISWNGKRYEKKIVQLDYDHIPLQTLALPNETRVVRLNIEKRGDNVGYINGAGDAIPESLRQIGYRVTPIDPSKISVSLLNQFDAIVMGIRAYNTIDVLRYKQADLLSYVENGGTLLVQYNTARGFEFPNIGPYPLQLSSDRVTDENAQVTLLNKKAEVLNNPNKINEEDFKGWVQERGLYFPNEWDEKYEPILSIHDKDEDPLEGSLLVAPYGKGHYIYTGLSFFRELPAGVPGAYRLFANLLSIGKHGKKTTN